MTEYLGYMIDKGLFGWYVADWDYEHTIWHGPFDSKNKALDWIEKRVDIK